MQEMIDKYDPAKNSREDNKKNKRHAGALAQAAPLYMYTCACTCGDQMCTHACTRRRSSCTWATGM